MLFESFQPYREIHTLDSLAVQWLELQAFIAKGLGSIPGQGTKISQVKQHASPPRPPRKNIQINLSLIPSSYN